MIAQQPVSQPASTVRRGRPPTPREPSTSAAARLDAELRGLRTAHDLTLAGLSVRAGYSIQYISQVEHGRAAPGEAFVQACDAELGADGTLMRLLPAVIFEQAQQRSARSAARRSADIPSDQEDDVDPINRRELAAGGAPPPWASARLPRPRRAARSTRRCPATGSSRDQSCTRG